jgi:hypothetical protein
MDEKPLGRRNYERFAERYAERTPTKPHNAYYGKMMREPCFLCVRARKPA